MRRSTVRLPVPLLAALLALAACDGHPPRQEISVEPQASTAVEPNQLLSTALAGDGGQPPANDPAPVADAEALPGDRCHPGYDPCVPIDSDVDCKRGKGNGPSYVTGPVRVLGDDVYDLDRDRDGIGCDR